MCSLPEVSEMIKQGKYLLLAAEEELLSKLPAGNWIGGSTRYFMTNEGAITSTEKVMVTELPGFISHVKLSKYNENTIRNVYADAFENGISFIIIPSSGKVHFSFALNAPFYENFAVVPLVGWLSAVSLDAAADKKATTFIGSGLVMSSEDAVVMHVELPKDKYANVDIITNFEQSSGDIIEFTEDGFNAKEAIINGTKQNLAKYMSGHKLDTQLPLVANYCGTMVNVSIQSIDNVNWVVNFFAPVFKNVKYKYAKPCINNINEFSSPLTTNKSEDIVFSCNCILNYLSLSDTEKERSKITGPVSFGEIAYQLLNQTFVYVELKNLNQ